MLGIYIHIPFCEKKCSYCAFSSFVLQKEKRGEYLKALIDEINSFHSDFKEEKYKTVDTIYIGGGTPSVLGIDELEPIINAVKNNFEIAKDYEWTIEANPNSLTEEKLRYYRNCGINRISIGLQSLRDNQLAFCGRLHNSEEGLKAINLAKKYFDNLSCDLLIGLKGMKDEELIEDVRRLVKTGIIHISTYMLQVEEGTPLASIVQNNPNILPDDDTCIECYDKVVRELEQQGFERYEVSNFAKKGYYSRHNFKYWSGEEYVGFGLSAHSLLSSTRYASADRIESYLVQKRKKIEKLSNKELIEEHIMLGLRCINGISKNYLLSLGYNIESSETYKNFIKRGILIKEGDKTYLNSQFYGVNNYIITSLLP